MLMFFSLFTRLPPCITFWKEGNSVFRAPDRSKWPSSYSHHFIHSHCCITVSPPNQGQRLSGQYPLNGVIQTWVASLDKGLYKLRKLTRGDCDTSQLSTNTDIPLIPQQYKQNEQQRQRNETKNTESAQMIL